MNNRSTASHATVLVACALMSAGALAQDLEFTAAQLLPGDLEPGPAAGHQEEMEIAAGGGGFLAVWSDCRSSLDNATNPEGSGYDVYGALLDADGNSLGSFAIDEGPGNQFLPHVAWNGENWLVAWMEPKPEGSPTFERIRGVRVSPAGTVLDSEPVLIHEESWGCYCSFFGMSIAGGGADGWVVLFHPNADGVRAVRVQSDGVVANPGGQIVLNVLGSLAFDVTFAQDEYMIVISDGVQAMARRYSPTLQFLGVTPIPFAREVATDGTNFLVTGQYDYSWPPKIEAILLGHDGSVLVPRFTVIQGTSQWSPSGEGVGFDGINYWVTWGGIQAARVTTDGTLLDPGGFSLPLPWQDVSWPAYDTAPGGGLQYVWHDGLGGAGYPKDVITARVTPDAQVLDQAPVSIGAPAQVEPDFAEGEGVHMLVYRSRTSGAARILAQRLDDNGVVLDPEPIEVASGPVQWLETPTIDRPTVAWNGSVFMVTWTDTINALARRINPDGSFVDATPLVVMSGQDAAVGALGSDFLVVSSTVGTLLANGALRFARVDGASGTVLDSPPVQLTTVSATISGNSPHVVALGNRWLVVWESVYKDVWSTTTIESTGIAFVEADGTSTGELDAGLGPRPNVAVAGDRALLVAVDDTVMGGTTNLDGRILMADGTFLGSTFPLSTAADEQLMPAATWDGTQFVVAWEDKRSSVIHFDERTDIYGARVALDGTVLDPGGVPLVAEVATEIRPELMTVDGTTLMAVSTLVSDDPSLGTFRIGIHRSGSAVCQPDLGFGGPGTVVLSLCGDELATGGTADLVLVGAPPSAPIWLVVGTEANPTPLFGGLIVPIPPTAVYAFTADGSGQLALPGLNGGQGPLTLFAQGLAFDLAQPELLAISNALQIEFLP